MVNYGETGGSGVLRTFVPPLGRGARTSASVSDPKAVDRRSDRIASPSERPVSLPRSGPARSLRRCVQREGRA